MSKNFQNIQITEAISRDARGILDLLHKTWLDTYPNKEFGITVEDIEESYKDSFTEENIKKLEEKIATIPSNQKRLVAKQGDLVVGVATMIKNTENNQLLTLYVLPRFQGQGIGAKLWKELEKFYDPDKNTILEVVVYSQKAISFYKKLGFVETGMRSGKGSWRIKKGELNIPEMEMIKYKL